MPSKRFNSSRFAPGEAVEPQPVIMPDYVLIAIAFILTSIGVVMVFSASGITSYAKLNDGMYFLKKEVFWVLLSWAGITSEWRPRCS